MVMIEKPAVHYNWATPVALYNELDAEFNFTIDVCAEPWNAKHKRYWTKEDDSLSLSWKWEICFMNPPYGRDITKWVAKAEKESNTGCTIVVGILPARTDTAWFHNHVLGKAELRFLRGRVKFERPDGPKQTPTFGTIIAVWRNRVAENN